MDECMYVISTYIIVFIPCVFTVTVASACWSPSQPFPTERAQSSQTDLRVGLRPHHILHTGTARPQPLELHPVCTYLLLGEPGLDTH